MLQRIGRYEILEQIAAGGQGTFYRAQDTVLDGVVAAEGDSPGNIVKITTYVTSINDWRASALEQQSLFNEYFKGEYPANTLVEITALTEPENRIGQR